MSAGIVNKRNAGRTGERLRALGFDLTTYNRRTGYYSPRCSQCEACVINGVACHETGCPNATHECQGCNEVIPQSARYCADCQ